MCTTCHTGELERLHACQELITAKNTTSRPTTKHWRICVQHPTQGCNSKSWWLQKTQCHGQQPQRHSRQKPNPNSTKHTPQNYAHVVQNRTTYSFQVFQTNIKHKSHVSIPQQRPIGTLTDTTTPKTLTTYPNLKESFWKQKYLINNDGRYDALILNKHQIPTAINRSSSLLLRMQSATTKETRPCRPPNGSRNSKRANHSGRSDGKGAGGWGDIWTADGNGGLRLIQMAGRGPTRNHLHGWLSSMKNEILPMSTLGPFYT